MGVPELRSAPDYRPPGKMSRRCWDRTAAPEPDQFVRSLEEEAAKAAMVMTPTAVPTKSPRIRPVRKANKSDKSICAPIRSASGRIRCLCQRTMAAPLTAEPGTPVESEELWGAALHLDVVEAPSGSRSNLGHQLHRFPPPD